MLADRVRMRFLKTGPKPEDIADENCKVATDADFGGDANGRFSYIGTATSLVIPHVIKGVEVTSYADMFEMSDVTEVRSNNPNITDMSYMFTFGLSSSLDLSNFDTSNVTTMRNMFYNCRELTSLDLSSFDTSNVTTMFTMFRDCRGLTSLDLSSFDTSNVTNMYYMFQDCRVLTSLDLSSFDTSNVTNMRNMFYYCNSLTSLDLSSFNTSNVTLMDNMFYYCNSITTAYARTQADADKFNATSGKPAGLTFVVK